MTDEMKGGAWLGAAREQIKRKAVNGDSCTWGSDEDLRGLTVREVEELAWKAVQADRRESAGKLKLLIRQSKLLREAQKAYMAVRGDESVSAEEKERLGAEVGYFANTLDRVLDSMEEYSDD